MIYVLIGFWCSVAVGSTVVVIVAKRKRRSLPHWVRRPYQFFVVGVFVLATLANVRFYIQGSLGGNTDAYVAFRFSQALINPLHFVVPNSAITGVLAPLSFDRAEAGRAAALMPLALWKTMIVDLVLGSCLYGAATLGVLRVVDREERQTF